MRNSWKRIENWLNCNAPSILSDLQPAASVVEIRSMERECECVLPSDVVRSYRIHNGSRGGAAPLFATWSLLSLQACAKEWKGLHDLHDNKAFNGLQGDADVQIKSDWWNPRWIPIASNSTGDFICIDLDPEPAGNNGQLIRFLHAGPERNLLCSSLEKWLADFADSLERGEYKVEDEWLVKM